MKIKLKLIEGENISDKIKRLDKRQYKTFTIQGENSEGCQEIVDVIKSTFTKKSSITLTEDMMNNYNEIKDHLRRALLRAF